MQRQRALWLAAVILGQNQSPGQDAGELPWSPDIAAATKTPPLNPAYLAVRFRPPSNYAKKCPRRLANWSTALERNFSYSVVLEPAEEGGYIVHVPALPELCTEGDTEAEALEMAKDAIEVVIASRLERGEPVPVEHGRPVLRNVIAHVA